VREALLLQRHTPPPTLEEAKLRLQLAAGQFNYSWISLVRARPYASTGIALVIGLITGRSARLRAACGVGLKKAFGIFARRD